MNAHDARAPATHDLSSGDTLVGLGLRIGELWRERDKLDLVCAESAVGDAARLDARANVGLCLAEISRLSGMAYAAPVQSDRGAVVLAALAYGHANAALECAQTIEQARESITLLRAALAKLACFGADRASFHLERVMFPEDVARMRSYADGSPAPRAA